MSTVVVSGSASGIGAATAARLREDGYDVLGIDLHDADVCADLSTPVGRAAAVRAVEERTDRLAGVVPAAGIAGLTGVDPALLVSVNYFGAVGLVAALRPLLAREAEAGGSPGVVLLSSNSVTCQPGWSADLAAACLSGDEARARAVAVEQDAVHAYPATKAALAYWARREGVKPAWAGAGVRVNALAPGMIATPMTDRLRADPQLGVFADAYPTAIGRPGEPGEVAALAAFLLSTQASLLVGSVVFADGGTDALLHPHEPHGMDVPPLVLGVADKVAGLLTRLRALRRR